MSQKFGRPFTCYPITLANVTQEALKMTSNISGASLSAAGQLKRLFFACAYYQLKQAVRASSQNGGVPKEKLERPIEVGK